MYAPSIPTCPLLLHRGRGKGREVKFDSWDPKTMLNVLEIYICIALYETFLTM